MENKIVIARVYIIKGKEQDFLALVPSLIEGTRSESGNIIYTLYQNPYNESEFIFYEEYEDDKAIKDHMMTPHFRDFSENVNSLLEKEMDIKTF